MADTRQPVVGGNPSSRDSNGLTPEVGSPQIWSESGKKWDIPTEAPEASFPGIPYPVDVANEEPELEEDYLPLGGINVMQSRPEPEDANGIIVPSNPEKTGGIIIPDNKSESSYSSSTSESSERLTKKYLRLISGLNISGKNKLLAVQIILALFAATGVAIVDSGATDIIRGLRIVRNGNCDSVVYKYGELEKMIPCKLKGLLIILRGVGVASIIPNVLDDIVYLASKTRGWVTGPGGDIKPPEGWP